MESFAEDAVNLATQVFRAGNLLCEGRQRVQIGMVENIEHILLHELVENGKIANHSGLMVDSACDGYLECVVMTVPVRIIALTINLAVFRFRHRRVMQSMRSGKMISSCEVSLHLFLTQEIREQVVGFVNSYAMQFCP